VKRQNSRKQFSNDLTSYSKRKNTSAIKLGISKKLQNFGHETFCDKLVANGRRRRRRRRRIDKINIMIIELQCGAD